MPLRTNANGIPDNSALYSSQFFAIEQTMKISEFCNKLEKAEAHSEFVIAAFCDIRNFSDFSKNVESADTSTFLKHFYVKLLRDYFQNAVFAKPTGDGLLIIFRHNEENLNQISELVLTSCFKAIKDFPTMFKSLPIINYAPPKAIGFGVARGSASYLIFQDEILDYSGKVLNLAARLNELAKPSGVVIDGNFQENAIPKKLRKRFQKKSVYLRGIAEDEPIKKNFARQKSHCLRKRFTLLRSMSGSYIRKNSRSRSCRSFQPFPFVFQHPYREQG